MAEAPITRKTEDHAEAACGIEPAAMDPKSVGTGTVEAVPIEAGPLEKVPLRNPTEAPKREPVKIIPLSGAHGGRIGGLLGGATVARALTASPGDEPFDLAPLPFRHDGLEPCLDRETMNWHHDVHHRNCVDKLNKALRAFPNLSLEGLALEDILGQVSALSPEVRFYSGGHWNHTFFWSVLTDRKEAYEISPELMSAIENSFGSLEKMKAQFAKAAIALQGSGWVWLLKDGPERLRIATTANNDNPLMDDCAEKGAPILVCDLWEHAYHSKFKARREDYMKRFFAIVNWAKVHTLYSGGYH